MAKLTRDDVLHVARLAKLPLTEKEVEKFVGQLSEVITYISQLSEVDTENTEPTSQTTGLTNVYRTDKVKTEESLNQEEAHSGTEKVYNGYFKVSAILEERSDK